MKQNPTLLRVQSMIQAGAVQISKRGLETLLEAIGYKLGDSFCYTNNLNAGESWRAKSFQIVEKTSNLSFAHVDAPKTNLKALQEIRFNYFVFENGKIWEI